MFKKSTNLAKKFECLNFNIFKRSPSPANNITTKSAKLRCCCRCKPDTILLLLTVLSVILGICTGIGIKYGQAEPLTPRQIQYLNFPGELFVRMLKLLILPLMFSSLVNSLANLDTDTAGRMGVLAGLYYLATIILAVATGIVLVLTIKPGSYSKLVDVADVKICKGAIAADTILDLFRSIFPDNLVEATFRTSATCVDYKLKINNGTQEIQLTYDQVQNLTETMKVNVIEKPVISSRDGMNVLGVIVFALVLGAILGRLGKGGKALVKFFGSLELAIMQMVKLVIWYSPIGIFCLIASQLASMNDLAKELQRLGMYMLTVMVGLFIHGCISLQLILIFLGRRNPIKFVYGLLQALLTAFGTASSNATLPLTLKCLEENNDIDKRVTKFVVPLGATVNMNGTALYEAVAAIYIAQCLGIELTIGQVILVSLTAVLASVGAAGIPQAGLVTMVMVLVAIGLPPQYFTLIIPIDWLLDRFRTMVNVFDDTVGCAVVQNFCQKQLNNSSKIKNMENDIKENELETQLSNEIPAINYSENNNLHV